MLSLFPNLLFLDFLGIGIIRIALGAVILSLSFSFFRERKYIIENLKNKPFPLPKTIPWFFGITTFVFGLLILIGLFTQLSVLVIAILMFNLLLIEISPVKLFNYPKSYYFFIMMVCISLIFIGAGAFGIDLPL